MLDKMAEKAGGVPDRKEASRRALDHNINPGTFSAQFSKWCRFYGEAVPRSKRGRKPAPVDKPNETTTTATTTDAPTDDTGGDPVGTDGVHRKRTAYTMPLEKSNELLEQENQKRNNR